MSQEAGKCPNCGSENLNYDTIYDSTPTTNTVNYAYECEDCGLEGKEWYNLHFTEHTFKVPQSDEEKKDEDPFALYYIGSSDECTEKEIERAKEVSKFLKIILDKMVKNIIDLDTTCEYESVMIPVANQIKTLYYAHVGVGDIETNGCICDYIENELKGVFSNDYKKMGQKFYNLIH